ncbi:MAG TPA: glycoside hydrolase family 2 TIM barrel-domain containing protein [Rectinemataceae bacterium]|nr:glycoside hydrolase family 2 TIM barrel-domain containing protein [Rectinemataceae bacterium]
MRDVYPLSSGWLFHDSPLDEAWLTDSFPAAGWDRVDLPHTLKELPFNHFDEKACQKKGTYCREFETPELPEGGRLFLDFEGVAVSCKIWLNGRNIGGHRGPYTPFSVDIGEAVKAAGLNRLIVEVDAREDPEIPPFGGVVDYLVYGGIYRTVHLRVQEKAYIERIHAHPLAGKAIVANESTANKTAANETSTDRILRTREARLSVDVTLGGSDWSGARIAARLSKRGDIIAEVQKEISGSGTAWDRNLGIEFGDLGEISLWDIDSPELYDLEVILEAGDRRVDCLSERIGFRDARFTERGFYLNGRRVFLRGLNRHQSWPYVGYAMGPGAQRRDAEMLKRELGLTIVRTSHYPQSRHFLDACDELGLLVFTELPGWQHIGGAAWKDQALADLGDLIRRDRHHPSVILWGVRINESPDDDELYARTNALAAKLDPDRQRGGVRNFRRSRLLEDVYTYNDFTHDGGKLAIASPDAVKGRGRGRGAPYLITEHNGHMFPTKRYDQEERLAEHARRHARVLDAAMGDPAVSGAIGWCAFDYNTHKDFGSGDRICYHGVSDMFRLPKYAAALYASQVSPGIRIVLEPATVFAKGERSAAKTLPIDVYTNCDAVDLYHAGEKVGRFLPDRETYPHLEHPPVFIDDLIGDRIDREGFSRRDKEIFLSLAAKVMTQGENKLELADKLRFLLLSLRRHMSFKDAENLVMKYGLAWGRADDIFEVVGILGGVEVARRTFSADARADRLEIAADHPVLQVRSGDEWDAQRVTARVLDQYGNPCSFLFEPLRIEVSGAARLIGPSEIGFLGGSTAFWVASVGREGEIAVRVTSGRFGERSLSMKAEFVHD